MFRFHLVEDTRVQFKWTDALMLGMGKVIKMISLRQRDVKIRSNNNELCEKLNYLLEKEADAEGFPPALIWMLSIEMGIRVHVPNGVGDYVRVWGNENYGKLLTRLDKILSSFGLEAKVKVEIKDFGVSVNPGSVINVVTEEVDIAMLESDEGAQLYYSDNWDKAAWDHTNAKKRREFSGEVTVSVVAYPVTSGDLDKAFPVCDDKPFVVKTMLEEGVMSDAKIIASDGEEIKCHKIILKAQSDVFEVMFKESSNTLESTTGTVKIEDMSSASVHAFLGFLYLDNLESAKNDPWIALDLLKAAHKYNVCRLDEKITQVLLMKPMNWFNLEVALELFMFATKMISGSADPLKWRAIAVLKADHLNLWDSPICKQLFKEHPDCAMELSKCLVSGDPTSSNEGQRWKRKKRRNPGIVI